MEVSKVGLLVDLMEKMKAVREYSKAAQKVEMTVHLMGLRLVIVTVEMSAVMEGFKYIPY